MSYTIGLISDTHGDLTIWNQLRQGIFAAVDAIIHCGDVLYHGPGNPITSGYNAKGLLAALNEETIPLYLVWGNCDAEVDDFFLKPGLNRELELNIKGLSILAHHGHKADDNERLNRLKEQGSKVFLSGHTHIPKLEFIEDKILMNPGSPSIPLHGAPVSIGKIIINDNQVSFLLLNPLNGEITQELTINNSK